MSVVGFIHDMIEDVDGAERWTEYDRVLENAAKHGKRKEKHDAKQNAD